MLVATVREVLDGLPFVFGAQSFQQARSGARRAQIPGSFRGNGDVLRPNARSAGTL